MIHNIITSLRAGTLILLSWGALSSVAFSQEQQSGIHNDHESDELEVGVSVGYAYLEEEKEEGINLHLHVMKRLSNEGIQKYLSIGFGVETIFTNEDHYGAMFSLGIHPLPNLVLTVSPGWEWEKHEGVWESGYATHIEATYVFEGSGFHYGPVASYTKAQDDQHFSIGMHFGMHF
jgi:hypothetical protein